MDPPETVLDSMQSNDGGKVKKVRKRPKTSCIPCSKKRQKCDRAQPCSSCVSRGIACKWETIHDGPSPSRSPQLTTMDGVQDSDVNEDEIPPALRTTKLDLSENREMLKMLSKRISSLESRVVSTGGPASAPAAVGPRTSSMSVDTVGGLGYGNGSNVEGTYMSGPFTSPVSTSGGVPGMVGGYDYVSSAPILAASMPLHEVSPGARVTSPSMHSAHVHVPARPQASRRQSGASFTREEPYRDTFPFSLVHPGEYVGRGSTSRTLHSIRSSSPFRLPQARSTAPMSLSSLQVKPFPRTLLPTAEIQHLVPYLPDKQSGKSMIDAFFKEVNWRYGIPEKWFSTTSCQMWTEIQNPSQSHQLNPYWLCLFFSVLACAPQPLEVSGPNTGHPNTYDSDTYYVCASTARRIAEDNYFQSSNTSFGMGVPRWSPSDGCVFGCLAIPLLCEFLAERGRVSEAWKLIGSGVRTAQSIGLHRDPGSPVWQEMPEEENVLRRTAWWGLYIWERLLSYVLGRPQMVRGDICDVATPSSFDGKGQKDSFNLSRVVMIQLANVVSEILDKYMTGEYPAWTILTEMDARFENLEMIIPAELRPGTTQEQDIIYFAGLSPLGVQEFNRHRYMISTWYRLTRLKLYTTAVNQLWQPSPLTTTRIESPDPIWETVAEKLVRFALELIKYQCDAFDRMRRTKASERWLGGNWYFEGCLSLFEATVALLLALTKFPTFFVPPGANMAEELKKGLRLEYEEMTRVISRVVDVFSEVVMSGKEFSNGNGEVKEGGRTEIASKALDTLQGLLKEHWWKLDPRTEQGRPLHDSSAQTSPPRTASSLATGMVGSGPGPPFGGAGYGSSSMSSILSSQQQPQVSFRGQAQQIIPVQPYSGLLSPASTETNPSRSSVQQHLQYQVQPRVYGSTAQYPMTTEAYSSSVQPPFTSPPLPVGNSPFPEYTQNRNPDVTPISPAGISHSSPYDYQPQNYFSSLDTPSSYTTTPFPFTPISSQSSSHSLDQTQSNLYQNPSPSQHQPQQQQQLRPQRYQRPPFSTPPNPSQPSPAQQPGLTATTYAYNPPTPSSTASSSGGGRGSGSVRTVRSSPGVPPPSQGMKMIHYVAPGSTTTSTTTASGMGVMGSLGAGQISFTVSGMSQDSSRQQHQSPPQPSQQSQQSTIVLSELMGQTTTPTSGLSSGDPCGGSVSGGYYNQ